MIQAIGKLQRITSEVRGTNFLIVDIELDVNGRPLGLQAKGQAGHQVLATIGDAPQGTLLEIYANPEFRAAREGDRVFSDLIATEALILNNIGTPGATFRLQGFLADIKSIPRKDGGSFEVGIFEVLAFDREGVHIPGSRIDVSLEDDALESWRANLGKYAFVRGTVSGYKTENKQNGTTRIWPRYQATSMSVMGVPSWLEDYTSVSADAGEAPTEVEDGEIPF
jgi:hypothetical protein